MSIISSIFSILDFIKNKLPISDRLESVKNEIDKLQKERCEIVIRKAEVKWANRLQYIDKRIAYLRHRLQNATPPS